MRWMLAVLGATLGGWIGWWLGNVFGLTAALFISLLCSGIGWYFGVRFYQSHLE